MKPKVTVVMAQTLDGKIALDADHFPDWTGKADKQFFRNKTQEAGCVIFGNNTFQTIRRPLPKRHNVIMTRSPQESEWENLEYTNLSPEALLASLSARRFDHVVVAGGTQINTLFFEQNLVDEIFLCVCPIVLGRGLPVFETKCQVDFSLVSAKQLDEQVVCLHYEVSKA